MTAGNSHVTRFSRISDLNFLSSMSLVMSVLVMLKY